MHRYLRAALVVPATLALALGAAACDEAEDKLNEAGRDAGEFVIRNAAAVAGKAKFDDEGYNIDGKLSCTAEIRADEQRASVSCTGTTEDGRPVTLEGEADEDKVREGTYVGKVDGEEVFSGDLEGN
jgi:hypothetical protein